MINDFKLRTIQNYISNFEHLDCKLQLTFKGNDYYILMEYKNIFSNIYVEYLSIEEIKNKIDTNIK